jgi:hypothetical protein
LPGQWQTSGEIKLMFKHLKDNCMGYTSHWRRAMSMSVALFIHAWLPDVLETYASNKMNEDKHD